MLTVDAGSIPTTLQEAGVAGAGGAGFPSYVKWQALDDVDYLLVNHQESEPNFYGDKWLGREHPAVFGELFESLLHDIFDVIVVGTKAKYRESWTGPLEAATDATVYGPADLPIEMASESGVAIAYTPDVYTYSEEKVLLLVTADEQIGDDLPTEHGWIVHNTETLLNCSRALSKSEPVTRKIVHVDGNTPRHRCLEVPIGTTAPALLEAAGLGVNDLGTDQILADGGPGWCYEITEPPKAFGVRKRTNAVLVLDRAVVQEHAEEAGHIDVLEAYDWSGADHETEPEAVDPAMVRIPLITNSAYLGLVTPSAPVVEPGDEVSQGDVIAAPGEGLSNTQHASIDGSVDEVTDSHIVIRRS